MASKRQRFAQRRKAVGLSQEGLAERLGVDRSTVVRWEAGQTEPQPWLRPKLARVLQVSIEQLDELLAEPADEQDAPMADDDKALAPSSAVHPAVATVKGLPDEISAALVPTTRTPQSIPPRLANLASPFLTDEYLTLLAPYLGEEGTLSRYSLASPQEREIVYDRLVQLLSTWADTMKRRELLRILSWAASAVAAKPLLDGLDPDEQTRVAQVLETPSRIDAATIDHIEGVLWHLIRQDDALGAQATLDTVLAQRNLVRMLLPECPSDLRPRLLSLFSNYSLQAGWLLYDLADFDSANYYYEHARTTAHEAENTELGALVLCTMSHLATWRGQPRVGIDHAVAAQGWAAQANEPRLRAYAADVAARAFAWDGQKVACLRQLDTAEANLVASDNQEPEESRMYFYTRGQFAGTKSHCLLRLGDVQGAISAGEESLALVDRTFVRNLAFTKLFLGDAYTATKEIDQAASVIGEAAALAVQNRSARLRERLRSAIDRLSPWRRSAAVRQLHERLRAYHLS